MQKHRRKQILADSVISDTIGLLISDFGSSTWGERHNSYYANPNQRTVHLVMFKISISRDLKNPTTSSMVKIQLSTQWQKLKSLPPWSNLNSQLTLFQNPQILRTISSGHDIIHSPVPFPVLGFIMTMVIVISFACECKTGPNDYAPELLTRTVQSPIKLNDKI